MTESEGMSPADFEPTVSSEVRAWPEVVLPPPSRTSRALRRFKVWRRGLKARLAGIADKIEADH